MPLGKTPAEIADDLAEKTAQLAEHLLEQRFPGMYKHIEASEVPPFHREAVRQALRDLLDNLVGEIPKEKALCNEEDCPADHKDTPEFSYNKARFDCIAVINKLKESV